MEEDLFVFNDVNEMRKSLFKSRLEFDINKNLDVNKLRKQMKELSRKISLVDKEFVERQKRIDGESFIERGGEKH